MNTLPCENSIHDPNCCFLCRNVRTDLSHDSNQGNLFYVGALPTHVWASDYHYSLRVLLETNKHEISLLYQKGIGMVGFYLWSAADIGLTI